MNLWRWRIVELRNARALPNPRWHSAPFAIQYKRVWWLVWRWYTEPHSGLPYSFKSLAEAERTVLTLKRPIRPHWVTLRRGTSPAPPPRPNQEPPPLRSPL